MRIPKSIMILVLLGLSTAVTSCKKNGKNTIARQSDYQVYLDTDPSEALNKLNEELLFWNNRIKQDSSQIIDIRKSAGMYTAIFQSTANINVLKLAEQNLTKGVNMAHIGKDGYLRALAQNYVTQHRFKEAKLVIDSAYSISGDISANNFIKFDIAMELGNYNLAEEMLTKEADFSNYNYLIRRAKWEDYKGNLSSTIDYMEKAKAIAEKGKQKPLMLWVYTNLADYYGHDGRIKDSYNHYLKALEIDPNNTYAKKGIAWIAYAHDDNPKEALRIIEIIEKENQSPDYNLLKAEIYAYQGNLEKSKNLTQKFIEEASSPLYGDMYNSYLLEIYANDEATASKGVAIAEREIKNRATPETYDLLSYAHLKNGDARKALDIQQQYVIGKTFEPIAQLHAAEIYKQLEMYDKVKPLKEELLEATFELGPEVTAFVKNL